MQLQFYPQKGDNIDERGRLKAGFSDRDVLLKTHSPDRFQLTHALEDAAMETERRRPDLEPGRYAVELRWSEPHNGLVHPILRVLDGEGRVVLVIEYPLTTLKGTEVYAGEVERNAELKAAGKVFYRAVADDLDTDGGGGDDDFEDEYDLEPSGEPELFVNVQRWDVHEPAIDLSGLPALGAEDSRPGDITVLCVPDELEQVARIVGDIPAEEFVELGWFLVGRSFRNGASGDLVLLIERAVLAQHTRSNASTLVIPPESHDALAADLTQVNERCGDHPLGPLRKLGWLHLHDLGAVAREEAATQCPGRAADVDDNGDAKHQDGDNRFFSYLGEALHRGNYPAASVALVLDAAACRKDPTNLERCYAAFGTIRGTVVRRGLHLLPRRDDQE